MNNEVQNYISNEAKLIKPNVFNYINYRSFLGDSFNFQQSKNSRLSESAFIQRAGYGANSRGYLKLILAGKRNISHKAVLGFAKSLKLTEKEKGYFENLVYFNQSSEDEEKGYYFEKMQKFIKGKESEPYNLLKSQYHYVSRWYLIAIRELVSLKDFIEDPDWISRKLRKEVSKAQVKEAIADLITLGLLQRNASGELEQCEAIVKFTDSSVNFSAVQDIQLQLLGKAMERIEADPYEARSASSIYLTVKRDDFSNIREDIKKFRMELLKKYGSQKDGMDDLLSMSIQLFHLSEVENIGPRSN